jgi:hypothetical protein
MDAKHRTAIRQPSRSSTTHGQWYAHPAPQLLLEVLAIAILCALAALGLWRATSTQPVYGVDLSVKDPTSRLEWVGFYSTESNGEFQYRWTRPYAFFQFQSAASLAPGYLAEMRLRVPAPDPDRALTFLANERPVVQVIPAPTFRVYRLALPAGADGAARLALSAPELHLPNDTRPLGVVMTSARLIPLRELPQSLLAVAMLGLAALWAAVRTTGFGRPAAGLLCVALGAGLASIWAYTGPAPLHPAWLAALALTGAAGAALATRHPIARIGLALLSVPVVYSGALRPSWLTDDAFISFRYAQNLARGQGLVYNLGERVEGYTNFLWTALAALVIRLGGDIVWWSYFSGIVLALALVIASFVLADRLLGPAWALAAALIVATSQSLLTHTARGAGLETGLFTLLIVLGSIVYLGTGLPKGRDARTKEQDLEPRTKNQEPKSNDRQRIAMVGTADHQPPATSHQPAAARLALAGLLLALATLTRPEGALVFGVTLLHCAALAIVHRPSSIVPVAPATSHQPPAITQRLVLLLPLILAYALVVIPFFIWRAMYYGDLLPNTFYAKTGGGLRTVLRGLEYAYGFALAFGGPLLLLILVRPGAGDPRPKGYGTAEPQNHETAEPAIQQENRAENQEPRTKNQESSTDEPQGATTVRNTEYGIQATSQYSSFVFRLSSRLSSIVHRPSSTWRPYLLSICGLYTTYIIAVGGDHFAGERFFVPLVPWLAVLIAGGLFGAAAWLRSTPLRPLVPLLLVLLVGSYGIYAYTRGREQDTIIGGSNESLGIWRELGWWLADSTPPDTTIAALSAGAVAFYGDRTTIDMLGLADKHIARIEAPEMGTGAAGHEKRDPAYVLGRRPTYIPQMWEDYFGGADALRGQYELVTITTRYGRMLEMWRVTR